MNQGFPGQHTTTVTASTTTVQPNVRFDRSYIKTFPAILKLAIMLVNLMGFLCIVFTQNLKESRAEFYNTVVIAGFWITGILFAFYLFHIIEKFYKIPWLKVEIVVSGILALFNLLSASLIAAYGKYYEAYAAAAFFGYCAMVGYGIEAFMKYVAHKSGAIAQGERQVSKQVSTVASPAY